ncbi:unnamed protein product, partial [marine sediment metagenome]
MAAPVGDAQSAVVGHVLCSFPVLSRLALTLGLLTVLLGGCGGRSELDPTSKEYGDVNRGGPTGSGGLLPTGGTGGVVSTGGSGGVIPTGGMGGVISTGGSGGVAPTGGTGGTGALGGTGAASGSAGSSGTAGSAGAAGQGGEAGAGGAAGAGGSVPEPCWAYTYGTAHEEEAGGVLPLSSGGVLLTGFHSAVDGDWDTLLLRVDADGNLLSTTSYGGSDRDWAGSLLDLGG